MIQAEKIKYLHASKGHPFTAFNVCTSLISSHYAKIFDNLKMAKTSCTNDWSGSYIELWQGIQNFEMIICRWNQECNISIFILCFFINSNSDKVLNKSKVASTWCPNVWSILVFILYICFNSWKIFKNL